MAKTARRTNPKLWEAVKGEVTKGDKGGRLGQWSARKAQMAVQEYKKEGGGYTGPKAEDNSLAEWTEENWGTESGGKSTATGERYLPEKARKALSPEEYKHTTAKKRKDKREGKQFSRQPANIAAKTARYRHHPGASGAASFTKVELLNKARELDIEGRSSMSKAQLAKALKAVGSAYEAPSS